MNIYPSISLSIFIESSFVKEFDVKHYLWTCEFRAAAINDWGWWGWHGMYDKYAY